MINDCIISEDEALQIIKNDLWKLALEKHAAQLREANPEKRTEIMVRIHQDIQQELRRRRERGLPTGALFH